MIGFLPNPLHVIRDLNNNGAHWFGYGIEFALIIFIVGVACARISVHLHPNDDADVEFIIATATGIALFTIVLWPLFIGIFWFALVIGAVYGLAYFVGLPVLEAVCWAVQRTGKARGH